jgi:hypothetical protein
MVTALRIATFRVLGVSASPSADSQAFAMAMLAFHV